MGVNFTPETAKASRAAQLARQASRIRPDTRNVRHAIKRRLHLRGLTIVDLASSLHRNAKALERVLSDGEQRQQHLLPNLLDRICDVLDVEPETRQHWHLLGALAEGWKVVTSSDLSPLERDHRYTRLRRVGCLCCLLNLRMEPKLLMTPLAPTWQPLGNRVEIHHLNEGGKHGGKRRGDRFTCPLCSWHHRGKGLIGTELALTGMYGPSWAGGSKPFRLLYPGDDELLAMADELIGWGDPIEETAF